MGAYQVHQPPFGINVELAMEGFHGGPFAAKQALRDAKTRHARRWQTKEGAYRLKGQPLPDVRDMDIVMADSSAVHS